MGASVLVNGGFLFAVAGLSAGHPPVIMEAPVFEVALEDFPVAAQAKAPPTATPSEARPEPAQAAPPPPAPSPLAVNKPAPPVETRLAATPSNTPASDTPARPTADQVKGTQGAAQGTATARPSQNSAQASAPAAPQAATVGSPTGSYAAQLRRHIESFKVYPRQAKRRRIEGEVTVAFTMDRQGRVLSSRIQKGSGSSELDQAALDMLEAAQPLPRPPADVPGDKLAITYSTAFSLED